MIKGIIIVSIIGAILYAIFDIWGIIVPVVLLVVLAVLFFRSINKEATTGENVLHNNNKDQAQPNTQTMGEDVAKEATEEEPPFMTFDVEINVGHIPMIIKRYHDDNNATANTIDVHKVMVRTTKTMAKYYISGYCHEIKKMRTVFRVDQYVEAYVDGKKIDIVEFINNIGASSNEYLKVMRKQQIIFMLNGEGKIGAEARILTFIARQIGQLVKKDKEMITDYLIQQHHLGDIDRDVFLEQLASLQTTPNGFRLSAKSIPLSDALLDFAFRLAGKDPMKKGVASKLEEYQNRQKKGTGPSAADLAKQALED